MIQNASKSLFLNYIALITMHLKWAWNLLLRISFYQHSNINLLDNIDDVSATCYKNIYHDCRGIEECVICLCRIDEDDEIRELSCDHLFHRGCLDRWLSYGNMTCPVCRNRLKSPAFVAELHQEVIYLDFCAAAGGGRDI